MRRDLGIYGEERWLLLRVFLGFKREKMRNARVRTAKLFGRSSATVARLVASWNALFRASQPSAPELRNFVFSPPLQGNRQCKLKRLSDANYVVLSVREFVRENS